MAKYCIQCGSLIDDNSTICSKCGSSNMNTAMANAGSSQKGNTMALIGFIISLVSLVLCCGSLSWLSLVFSIIGIVSANKVAGKGKGFAIAGIIISALGMILLVVSIFLLPYLGYESIQSQVEDQWQDISDYSDNNYDSDSDFDFDY